VCSADLRVMRFVLETVRSITLIKFGGVGGSALAALSVRAVLQGALAGSSLPAMTHSRRAVSSDA
jgi:hypothetical protein